jgi:hypothetical protein
MIGQVSIAAATAVLGYDLAAATTWRVAGNDRTLNAGGIAGSAAALDTKIDLFVGNTKVGEMFNASTGAVARNTDMFRVGVRVPAGMPISAIITDAPATNPINLTVDLTG